MPIDCTRVIKAKKDKDGEALRPPHRPLCLVVDGGGGKVNESQLARDEG